MAEDEAGEGKRTMQRSREGQPVTEEMRANYTAVRAFLYGEWFGACLMVASFTLLYLFAFATPNVPLPWVLGSCGVLLAVGSFVFLRNRAYYERLEFPWAKRWHIGALVTAGAGAIFWILLGLLLVLAKFGVDVGPPGK